MVRAVPRRGSRISKGTEAEKYRDQQQETSTARSVRVEGEHCKIRLETYVRILL